MAASAACSHPHVFAHTLRFSTRGFLALTPKCLVFRGALMSVLKQESVNVPVTVSPSAGSERTGGCGRDLPTQSVE